LVGIIFADMALHQPDFRAGERTFQLLTQVSGRAGRGDIEGEVVVQAFTPFHPAIQFARRHDFKGYYDQEIESRTQLRYPPFSRVALLTLRGRNEEKVKFSADHVKRELEKMLFPKAGDMPPGSAHVAGEKVKERFVFRPAPVGLGNQPPPPGEVIVAGPAAAPLLRADSFYRYQLMLRVQRMTPLSQRLANLMESLSLPDDVRLSVDIDPMDLG